MSQENVELIQRFYQHYFETGEVPWDIVDEAIELRDHDAPDQSGVYRGQRALDAGLMIGTQPGPSGVSSQRNSSMLTASS
jgi:hypothetical protein